MQQLIICVGLPASGKSTFSKSWVLEDPKTRVRVCRDDIRRMLGLYWVPTSSFV
jgi:predicted kinase